MKDLFQFVEECDAAATPGNTMGMGNPTADDGDGKGSEPIAKAKAAKAKKHPHRKHKKAGEEE